MGIVIKSQGPQKREHAGEGDNISDGDIWFFQKGTDTVISSTVGQMTGLKRNAGIWYMNTGCGKETPFGGEIPRILRTL